MNSLSNNYIITPELSASSLSAIQLKPTTTTLSASGLEKQATEDSVNLVKNKSHLNTLPSVSSLSTDNISPPLKTRLSSKNSNLSFSSYIFSLLKAALRDDRQALQKLFEHPIFESKIPIFCKRASSAFLIQYLINLHTKDFSTEVFLKLIQRVIGSSYIATLSELEILDIYERLFSCPQIKNLHTVLPLAQIRNTPSQALPYVLIETLKHKNYTNLSLSQVLAVFKLFNSQSPLLQSTFFKAFFNHPTIRILSKDILLYHFRQLPPAYKTSFLTEMIQVDSFKKTTFIELIEFIKEFRSYPRNEEQTILFYKAIFKHPAVKSTSNLASLKCIFPEEASDEVIPILNEVTKHPQAIDASLKTIKFLMKSFNVIYKQFPCSDQLVEDFYTSLFKMPNMSKASMGDLEIFLRKSPSNLFTLANSFAFRHSSFQVLPLETFLTAFKGFLLEGNVYPNSRHVDLRFIKAALAHPVVQKMESSEILEKIITPAKGYQLIDIILTALSSPKLGAFSLSEISTLHRLFLDEIESLEGPKSPSRVAFYSAICDHLQEKALFNKSEARAETHKLVHSYQKAL